MVDKYETTSQTPEALHRLVEANLALGLENEAACYVGTAGHMRTFLDKLGCSRVKALWDPANHVQDPQGRDVAPFPNGYDLIKNDMVHVHVKVFCQRTFYVWVRIPHHALGII